MAFSKEVLDDLKKSGLSPADMRIKPLGPMEMAATRLGVSANTPLHGYVIPYFTMQGTPEKFYRVKVIGGDPSYKQVKGSQNHIYFPPGLGALLKKTRPKYFLLTEGEKKAAAAVKAGFPCAAVTGVDSWRNRIMLLPAATEFETSDSGGWIRAKLPKDEGVTEPEFNTLAHGMAALIAYCTQKDIPLLICYDTDDGEVKPEVQTAAARLGYELRYRGLPIQNIRQLILPSLVEDDDEEEELPKIGLDDFLVHADREELIALIDQCMKKRIAFPRHPNPRTFINGKLQKPRISRKEQQDLAMAILMELESRGKRFVSAEQGKIYYFDDETHTLMQVDLDMSRGSPLHETHFGQFLYSEFNISAVDNRLMGWIAALYTGEPGMEPTKTRKVLAQVEGRRDCIAVQLGDADFVVVTPDPNQPFLFRFNGSDGVLFEQDQVDPIHIVELKRELARQSKVPLEMHWLDVLNTMNFREPNDEEYDEVYDDPNEGGGYDEEEIQRREKFVKRDKPTADQQRLLAALLYYISPWVLRWRGTQLPIELMLGEAGSGKSSVYGLRQTIIAGHPNLNNLTNDIKDWYASITARGGLHVLDNVKFVGSQKDYRQRLSDEICRLVTEPNPTIELRKLYTTSDILRLPVMATFAMTAIEQPFYAQDLIQRATIFELKAVGGDHDADWTDRHLRRVGGRVGWLAHHLWVLHLFLRKAIHEGVWDPMYKAHHRLANYEQCLSVMARVFGLDTEWIPQVLARGTKEKMTEADWALQGLKVFVEEMRSKHKMDIHRRRFSSADIAAWAEAHQDYFKNAQLTNTHRLGRYLQTHAQMIERVTGLYELTQKVNNRRMYGVAKGAHMAAEQKV